MTDTPFDRYALKYDPDTLGKLQHLWEGVLDLSSTRIGAMFGLTKNVVIGQANRRGWQPRREPPADSTTLHQRMDAAHARMDAVLAETRQAVEGRRPAPPVLMLVAAAE